MARARTPPLPGPLDGRSVTPNQDPALPLSFAPIGVTHRYQPPGPTTAGIADNIVTEIGVCVNQADKLMPRAVRFRWVNVHAARVDTVLSVCYGRVVLEVVCRVPYKMNVAVARNNPSPAGRNPIRTVRLAAPRRRGYGASWPEPDRPRHQLGREAAAASG
jgi:hypothetical protein